MEHTLIKNAMIEIWNLSDRTTELIFDVDENIDIAVGRYELKYHQIKINLVTLLKIHKEKTILNDQIDLVEFCKIIMTHELAHSIDPLLKNYGPEHRRINQEIQIGIKENNRDKVDYNVNLRLKSNLFFEMRAWRIARRTFSKYINKEHLYIMMRDDLKSYINLYKRYVVNS